jgi:hypothetical protein
MNSFRVCVAGAVVMSLAAMSGCAPAATPQPKIHRMGDRVNAGSLVYNVFETQWKTELGEGTSARIPKDRFFLVRLSVVNSGSSESMIPTLTLIDDAGQAYEEVSNGDQVPSWIGFLRRVKPAETLQGNAVFDVPPKHYRLRVSDENDQKSEQIDIPLSFSVENPAIPPLTQ